MNSISRSHAQVLFRYARRMAPSERADWFEAMASEMEHVPDKELTSFVCGCLIVAARWRISSADFVLSTAHSFLIAGAIFWAAMNLWLAGRLSITDSQSAEKFAYCIAAVFLAGAVATARFGFKATIGLGVPLMLLLGIGALTAKTLLIPSTTTALFYALIVEDVAVLLFAVIVAFIIPRLVTTQKAIEL